MPWCLTATPNPYRIGSQPAICAQSIADNIVVVVVVVVRAALASFSAVQTLDTGAVLQMLSGSTLPRPCGTKALQDLAVSEGSSAEGRQLILASQSGP